MPPSPYQLKIHGGCRWCIYHRLKDLGIPCHCRAYQPLDVTVDTATQLLQIWSVTRQYTTAPEQLKNWLEKCWQHQG